MTKAQIDKILKRVREWPEKRQEDAVRMLAMMEEQNQRQYHLTDEQVKEVKRIRRGLKTGKTRFATKREIDALWKKCGL